MLNGSKYRFVGANQYSFVVGSMSQPNVASLFGYAIQDGMSVFRTWALGPNFRSLSGSTLNWDEPTFIQLDMVSDEAMKVGLKLWLSVADNPTYNTKLTYINWANAVYGTSLSTAYPYTAFFDDPGCRTLYKQFIFQLLNRKNTINGRVYKNDDTFNFLELINEGRYDLFTSEGGTQNTVNAGVSI